MKDWRGLEYDPQELLGVPCSVEGCVLPAVRHVCNAEGDANRTHWHGEIHSARGGGSRAYCAGHGMAVLNANAARSN